MQVIHSLYELGTGNVMPEWMQCTCVIQTAAASPIEC